MAFSQRFPQTFLSIIEGFFSTRVFLLPDLQPVLRHASSNDGIIHRRKRQNVITCESLDHRITTSSHD